MNKLIITILVSVSVAASSAAAQSFARDVIVVPVNGTGGNTFEVVERPLIGPTQFWCAAGIYAKRKLGVQRGNIYIANAYGPAKTAKGGRGVTFSTDEVPGAFTNFTLNYRQQGLTKSVGAALAFCETQDGIRVRIRTDTGRYTR